MRDFIMGRHFGGRRRSDGGSVVTAPTASGGIADQSWVEDSAITPLDVSADFSGTAPITYALAPESAALPAGLSLSGAGVISGTPTTPAAPVNIVVRGTNSAGHADTTFGVTVTEVVTAPTASGGIADQSWVEDSAITPLDVSADFSGTAPITYALAPGSAALPAGLSLSGAGVISGTPTTPAAQVNIVVRGTNSAGHDDTAFGVTVTAAADTTIAFGALTLAGAGGVAKPASASAISDAGGTNLVLSGGYAVPDTGGGVTSGTVVWDDATEWTVTAEADVYSVGTGELAAVLALGSATIDGKTIKGRPGADLCGSNVGDTVALTGLTFTTGLTITSHDPADQACMRRIGGAFLGPLAFEHVTIRDTFRVGTDTWEGKSAMILVSPSSAVDRAHLTVKNCEMYDTNPASTYDRSAPHPGGTGNAAVSGTTVSFTGSPDLSSLTPYEHGIRINGSNRTITAVDDTAKTVTVSSPGLTGTGVDWVTFRCANRLYCINAGYNGSYTAPDVTLHDNHFHDYTRAFAPTQGIRHLSVLRNIFTDCLDDHMTVSMWETSVAVWEISDNRFGQGYGAGAPYDPHVDGFQMNMVGITTSGQNANPIKLHGNIWRNMKTSNGLFFEGGGGGTIVVDLQHNIMMKTGEHAISVEGIAAGSIIKGNTILWDHKYGSGDTPQIRLSGSVEDGIEVAYNIACAVTGAAGNRSWANHTFGFGAAANDAATVYVPLFEGAAADFNGDNHTTWQDVINALTPDGNTTLWPANRPRIGALGGYYDYTTHTASAPWDETGWTANRAWGDLTGQGVNSAVASSKVQVMGVGSAGVDVAVLGGTAPTLTLYDTDGTTVIVSGVDTVLALNNQYVEVHDTSAGGGSTQVDVTIIAGNTAHGTWSHTTEAVRSIADIVGDATGSCTWAPTGAGVEMHQEDSATTLAGNGDPVGRITRGAGTNNPYQPTAGMRGTRNTTTGLIDMAGDFMQVYLSTRSTDMYVAFVVNSTQDQLMLVSGDTNQYAFICADGNSSTTLYSNAGTPTLKINGTTFSGTTRDDLHTAICTGNDMLIEIVGINLSMSQWTPLEFGSYAANTAYNLTGAIGDYVVLNTPSADDQTIIREELAARHGITLP